MTVLQHMRILGCTFLATAALLSVSAQAATVTLNFSGATTSAVTDTTNYFGLGTSINPGASFAMTVLYDDTVGSGSGSSGICGSGCNFRVVERLSQTTDPAAFAFGPTHITSVALTINGVAANIATSQFTTHNSRTREDGFTDGRVFGCPGSNPVVGCTSATARDDKLVSITGDNGAGNSIALSFVYSFVRGGTFSSDPLFNTAGSSTSLSGSLALILLATDGSTLINLAGQDAFGIQKGGTDVPIPAALPLMLAGLVGLGGLSKARKKKLH